MYVVLDISCTVYVLIGYIHQLLWVGIVFRKTTTIKTVV